MTTLNQFLTREHEQCDEFFSAAENAVAASRWPLAREAFDRFVGETRAHFRHEEDILFPAFEARTGMSGGPTAVMRQEHAQMLQVFAAMDGAVTRQDGEAYLGYSETLLILLQQHNLKEQNILYPMADQALAAEREELLERMEATL